MYLAGMKLEDAINNTQYALEYEKALKAVEKAERSNKQVDVKAARKLVNALENGNPKKDLKDRLDYVEQVIDAIADVVYVEDFIAKEDFNLNDAKANYKAAKASVEALKDGKVKTDLEARLEAVKEVLDDASTAYLEKQATDEVKLAEINLEKKDYAGAQVRHDSALKLVEALEDGEVKTDLEARLAKVKKAIEKANAEYTARKKVELAEENAKNGSYKAALIRHDEAVVLVEALEDGDVKTALKERLAKVATAISNYDAAKEVQDMIAAIPADSALNSKDTTVAAARTAFDALTEAQQALVNNVDRLEAKEAYLAKVTSDLVWSLIEDLPASTTDANSLTQGEIVKIKEAKVAYDALSPFAKDLVPSASVTKLNTLLGKIK